MIWLIVARRHCGTYRHHLAAALLTILAAGLMSACIDVEVSSEYRLDGSASHAIEIQIEHVPADRSEADDLVAILAELEQRSTNAGLEFERTEQAGLTSIRISGTTSEGQEAGAALNSLINATGISVTPGVTAPFRGTFRRETGAIGGSSYMLDLSVDGELLFESVVFERLSVPVEEQREVVSLVYVATFPGDVTRTTGEQIGDRTVRWTVPFEGVTDLHATARTGGAGSAALFIIVGVAAAVVIVAIAAGLGWYLARRKRLSATLGGAIHRLPGQQTITHEGIWVARKISGLTHRLTGHKPDGPLEK
jgi:hypothetical protein